MNPSDPRTHGQYPSSLAGRCGVRSGKVPHSGTAGTDIARRGFGHPPSPDRSLHGVHRAPSGLFCQAAPDPSGVAFPAQPAENQTVQTDGLRMSGIPCIYGKYANSWPLLYVLWKYICNNLIFLLISLYFSETLRYNMSIDGRHRMHYRIVIAERGMCNERKSDYYNRQTKWKRR